MVTYNEESGLDQEEIKMILKEESLDHTKSKRDNDYVVTNIDASDMWEEVMFMKCPFCKQMYELSTLELIEKYSEVYEIKMYFAVCPSCGKEFITFV